MDLNTYFFTVGGLQSRLHLRIRDFDVTSGAFDSARAKT